MGNAENPKCACQAKISYAHLFSATLCYEETLLYFLICGGKVLAHGIPLVLSKLFLLWINNFSNLAIHTQELKD